MTSTTTPCRGTPLPPRDVQELATLARDAARKAQQWSAWHLLQHDALRSNRDRARSEPLTALADRLAAADAVVLQGVSSDGMSH